MRYQRLQEENVWARTMGNRRRRSPRRVKAALLAGGLVGLLSFSPAVTWAQGQRGLRGGGANGQQDNQSARPRGGAGGNRMGGRQGGLNGGQWWRTRARFDEQEIFEMAGALHLDDGQIGILSAMFAAFDDAYQAEADSAQAGFDKMREEIRGTGDWASMMPKMVSVGRESEFRAAALERSFLADIRENVLTKGQRSLWAAYERERRRRATLSQGARIPGEGIDLYTVVDELELAEGNRDRISRMLDSYATELDDALVDRDQYVANTLDRIDEVLTGKNGQDPDTVFRKGNEKRETLRDINAKYAELLASQLDAETGRRLVDAFNRKAYPRVYRDTAVEGYVAKVTAIEDMSGEQRDALDAIQRDYQARMADLNQQLAVLETKRQGEQQKRMYEGFRLMYTQGWQAARENRMQMFRERMNRQQGQDGTTTDPVELLQRQKNDLETATLDAFVDVLTAAQLEQAPRPTPEADRVQRQEERAQRISEWRERMQGRRGERGTDM